MEKRIVKEIESACDAAFASFGFNSRRRGNPLIALDDDFYGWIGLNRSNERDVLRIEPFIGLHCISVMQLWYELDHDLRKKKYVPGSTATVALHLGALAPDTNAFIFERQGIEGEAHRLARCVADFGLPWMRAHANLKALCPLLRERENMLGGFPERVAIVLFLLGRFREVSEYLDARAEEYGQKPAWAQVLESWKHFSEALRTRLPQQNGALPD
jgi:hypothetical protein